MTLPNLITIGRLILVPIVILTIAQSAWLPAFLLFAVAGVSDAADGIIARRYGLRSELGAYLDPIADKALLVSIYVSLAIVGSGPVWLAVVIVSRDVMIVGAVVISRLLDNPVEIKPLLISKANTAIQIALAAAILAIKAAGDDPAWILGPGGAVVAGLTLASAAAYLASWLRHMAG